MKEFHTGIDLLDNPMYSAALFGATLYDYADSLNDLGNSGAAQTLDRVAGATHIVTLTADCAFDFANPAGAGTAHRMRCILVQDGTGGRQPTFSGAVWLDGGVAPDINYAAGGVTVLEFVKAAGYAHYYGYLLAGSTGHNFRGRGLRSRREYMPGITTYVGSLPGSGLTPAGSVSHPNIATTNGLTATRRTRWTSSTTANAVGGILTSVTECLRGNATGIGGFAFRARFGQNVNTNGARAFVGLCSNAQSAVVGEPGGNVNIIGMGYDSTDSSAGNWFFIRNDNVSTATKVDLGSSAERNTSSMFDLIIEAEPNASYVLVTVLNAVTGMVILPTASYSTDLPINTTPLYIHAAGGSAATAVGQQFELAKIVLES